MPWNVNGLLCGIPDRQQCELQKVQTIPPECSLATPYIKEQTKVSDFYVLTACEDELRTFIPERLASKRDKHKNMLQIRHTNPKRFETTLFRNLRIFFQLFTDLPHTNRKRFGTKTTRIKWANEYPDLEMQRSLVQCLRNKTAHFLEFYGYFPVFFLLICSYNSVIYI